MPKQADLMEIVCEVCGESVSGPDAESVNEVMDRHVLAKHDRSEFDDDSGEGADGGD